LSIVIRQQNGCSKRSGSWTRHRRRIRMHHSPFFCSTKNVTTAATSPILVLVALDYVCLPEAYWTCRRQYLLTAFLGKLCTFNCLRPVRTRPAPWSASLKKLVELLPHIVSRKRTFLHAK